MERRVVVLDRDGVINRDLGRHVLRWEEFEFLPGALEAIARLCERGFYVSIASNQSCIEAGLLSTAELETITHRMNIEIVKAGGRLDGVYYCPHTTFARCMCRKPRPGLLLDIARRHAVDPASLIVIGDAMRDAEAAMAVGARPVMVACGKPLPANAVMDQHGESWVPVGNTKVRNIPVYRNLEDVALCLM